MKRYSSARRTAAEGFCGIVGEVGTSPRLPALMRSFAGIVPGNFFSTIDGAMETSRGGFQRVARAILARNPGEASRLFVEMMREQGENVIRARSARLGGGSPPPHEAP